MTLSLLIAWDYVYKNIHWTLSLSKMKMILSTHTPVQVDKKKKDNKIMFLGIPMCIHTTRMVGVSVKFITHIYV